MPACGLRRHPRLGDIPYLQYVLSMGGSVALTDTLGRNALHWAVICRKFDAAALLLHAGAIDAAAVDREVCAGR